MKPLYVLFSLVLIISLAACSQPAPVTPTPTQAKVVATTVAPVQQTLIPAVTLTLPPVVISPTPTSAPATQPPVATQALPTPTRLPPAATSLPPTATSVSSMPQVPEVILIQAPGLTSSIISPVTISGQSDSTFEQNLVVKVAGEDGVMIASKSTTIQAELGKRGAFSLSLPFKVSLDQPGRVSIYATSPKDGGLIHFSSVEVLLLKAGGKAALQPGKQQNEVLVITQPAAPAAASGGKLHVEGWSGPVFENQIVVILCGEGGSGKADPFCGTVDNILARVPVTIQAPDVGQPGPFSVDLSYKVSKTVSGRVAVYYTSPRDGYLLHLASIPVQLNP